MIIFLILTLSFSTINQYVSAQFIEGRIISGKEAVSGQFPWQVILKRNEMDDLLCGGSIIDPFWVLTAAHCTYGLNSIFLMFGTIELDDNLATNMTSRELYVHPAYNAANLNNDVSLIKLPTQLIPSNTIKPIRIVTSAEAGNTYLGALAIVAGFGLTDDEYLDFSQNLMFAHVEIIDNAQCVNIFGSNVVVSSTMCANGANRTNMSTCSGDSGGPLITLDASGSYVQIGINSFVALDKCTEGFPSGYARLTSFITFIQQTIG